MARTSLRTGEVDRAMEAIKDAFYANRLDVLARPERFGAAFEVLALDGITVGDLVCGADVRVRCGELGCYHVNIPVGAPLAWHQASHPVQITAPGTAALFQPDGKTSVDHWTGEGRVIAIKFERSLLERRVEELTGRAVRGPILLDPALDLTQGRGRTWASLVGTLVEDLHQPMRLVEHPLVAAPLRDAILNGLLLSAQHRYRDELDRPAGGLRPAPVKRAMDAMRERPEHPFTTAELAAQARVGVRWLQEAFARYVGMPPMTYLRSVRLERAHADLCAADPRTTTVGDIAHRWGFGHLGRFAEQYRAKYGRVPSQSLREGPDGVPMHADLRTT
ncbi:AraC family transcriptional regulator [Streptomyces sp. VRA16 Mangrove soil]|uniref:AraC family transcriptional regulator n=1 Tax=Streptomyces sp. VRA16 Mangrove soil TaxID=2817434 RepID=UPI001A9E7AA5|nr:AraC family transcriptional regulator [Streptomyces sp. VRA16 Mangrove soil]MBO1331092.1 AraC family transcriptional regulator [Streptomyces sp. VRA16 Mangrove soil]